MGNADRIKAALDMIDTGLATINTDEDWLHFLTFQGILMMVFLAKVISDRSI